MRRVQYLLFLLCVVLMALFFSLLVLLFRGSYSSIINLTTPGESFLIVGIDTGGKANNSIGGRTDYIALFYLDDAGTFNIKSIPRDTVITHNGATRKINSLYNSFGMNALISQVETLTKRKISGFVIVDFNTVNDLTDFTGPIRVDVLSPMHHDDYQQDLHIHFETGVHYLEGEDLLKYLRFRSSDTGDLGRIERQKYIINQLVSQLIQAGPKKILELIDYVMSKTEINVDKKTLLGVAYSFLRGSRSITFSQIDYYLDRDGQIIPREPAATTVQTPVTPTVSSPTILVINNIPDYQTRLGDFVETVKSQWLKQASIKVEATGIVPEIPGIEKRETYLFINSRASEVRDAFSLAHLYHNPGVITTYNFANIEKYYALLDSLSKERFYPVTYDALVLLGVGGR